jgi:quercetin dioxygenase-like cupin family protein
MKKFTAILIILSSLYATQSIAATEADHVMIKPQDMKWTDAPPSLPAGAKVTMLYGDPSKEGPFGMRIKMPAKYQIAPHYHSQDENITVISGTFFMAKGGDLKTKPMALPAGSFARMTANTHHFAKVDKETVVQLNSMGPWTITYLDAKDDPRKP